MKPSIGMIKTSQQQLLDQESPTRTHSPDQLALAPSAEQAQAPAQDPESHPLGDFFWQSTEEAGGEKAGEPEEPCLARGARTRGAMPSAQPPSPPLSNLY